MLRSGEWNKHPLRFGQRSSLQTVLNQFAENNSACYNPTGRTSRNVSCLMSCIQVASRPSCFEATPNRLQTLDLHRDLQLAASDRFTDTHAPDSDKAIRQVVASTWKLNVSAFPLSQMQLEAESIELRERPTKVPTRNARRPVDGQHTQYIHTFVSND